MTLCEMTFAEKEPRFKAERAGTGWSVVDCYYDYANAISRRGRI